MGLSRGASRKAFIRQSPSPRAHRRTMKYDSNNVSERELRRDPNRWHRGQHLPRLGRVRQQRGLCALGTSPDVSYSSVISAETGNTGGDPTSDDRNDRLKATGPQLRAPGTKLSGRRRYGPIHQDHMQPVPRWRKPGQSPHHRDSSHWQPVQRLVQRHHYAVSRCFFWRVMATEACKRQPLAGIRGRFMSVRTRTTTRTPSRVNSSNTLTPFVKLTP